MGHDVGNNGERKVAGANDWVYFAHLSIYRYFADFVRGQRILEIGSGTGYGANYLADYAQSIVSIDVSTSANQFCRENSVSDRIDFRLHDLSVDLLPDEPFPVIVTSNALEHVPAIDAMLANCAHMLRPDGLMIIAVPPVNNPAAFIENFRNPFHVTNLTPLNWHAKLSRFFESVECFRHWVKPEFEGADGMPVGLNAPAERTVIRENDFAFQVRSPEGLMAETHAITAVFAVRGPRIVFCEPTLAEELPREWHVGKLTAQVLVEELARRERELKQSRSWRVTAPLRALTGLSRRSG